MLLLRATAKSACPLIPVPVQAEFKTMSDHPHAQYDDNSQLDGGWSWPPGWCLRAPARAVASYSQLLAWNPQPRGLYAPASALQPPSTVDIQQQIEEAVQRAVQVALPAVLGPTTSQPSLPPPPSATAVPSSEPPGNP